MSSYRIVILLILVLMLSDSSTLLYTAQAEDQRLNSGNFFDKNYAQNPLEKKSSTVNTKTKKNNSVTNLPKDEEMQELLPDQLAIEEIEKQQQELLKNNPQLKELMEGDAQQSKDSKEVLKQSAAVTQEELTGFSKVVPIKNVAAIISSAETPHFEKSIKQLIDLVDKKQVKLATIKTIGDFNLVMNNPLLPALVARGGMIAFLDEVPEGYPVTLSPTYIVNTEEGQILLEAVGEIGKYFNQNGDFLEPQIRKQSTPKQQLEPKKSGI